MNEHLARANEALKELGWNWQWGGGDPHGPDAPHQVKRVADWMKVVGAVEQHEMKLLADIDELSKLRVKMEHELGAAVAAALAALPKTAVAA